MGKQQNGGDRKKQEERKVTFEEWGTKEGISEKKEVEKGSRGSGMA